VSRAAWLDLVLALLLAPLVPGLVSRVKARFAGRQGPPLLQLYFDLGKLLRKGAVYSTTSSWLFRAGPVVSLAAAVGALSLVPAVGQQALVSFPGDFVLFAYLLALGRLATVLAALDTGSSFEGMGASREVQFAVLAEPALLLGLLTLARPAGSLSLATMLRSTSPLSPEVLLVAAALAIVLLCENSRVPFDDPSTHLELTMIHEVMVLDHGGPELALVSYAAALKLWLWCLLLVGVLLPPALPAAPFALAGASVLGVLLVAIAIGVVESSMARVRLLRVPQLLATALMLSAVAFILGAR
jgi:formate hydrogenlyase subunit 4